MKQSRVMSMVEAVTNVVVGYGLAIATQVIIFPMFGIEITTSRHLAIGGVFTVVSLIRSFALRRVFEALRVRRLSGGSSTRNMRFDGNGNIAARICPPSGRQ